MSKYDALWKHILSADQDCLILSFDEIATIAGVPVDHSFLRFKRELNAYGYTVSKISMKAQNIRFDRITKTEEA